MNWYAKTILPAAICFWALTLPSCSLRGHATQTAAAQPAPPKPPAPKPPPVETTDNLPISVPQTQVTLPTPQPIQAEALATLKPEPPAPKPVTQPSKPTPQTTQTTRTETRGPATVQGPPAGPPPPPPTASRRRIRPVESVAERRRLLTEITNRQRNVQGILAKTRSRQLTEAEKNAVDRIQAFLNETAAAVKDQDLQQAEALSNRALLLCQELSAEK
jgi:hypothetical protein